MMQYAPAEEAPETPPAPAAEQSTMLSNGEAYLSVNVPADARVFVNGQATTSVGTQRTYVSRGLTPGTAYDYRVRVETTVDGEARSETKLVKLQAGQNLQVGFDFQAATEAVTTLKLNVPEGAKVTLAGQQTESTGSSRTFATKALSAGQQWKDYTIQVAMDRDGKSLVQEKTITLIGGETRELTIGFDEEKVAAR